MSKINKIVNLFSEDIQTWTDIISKQQYKEAKLISKYDQKICRENILFNESADENLKKISLLFGIFFRGLEELTDLAEIIATNEWFENKPNVENAWVLLLNCKDRFGPSLSYIMIPTRTKDTITSFLETIEKDFLTLFGPGQYVSPEIVIKRSVCSICKSNYRTCPHLPGHIYGGKICRCEPIEVHPGNCIVMLPYPKDRRCRIWPWRDSIPLIYFFKIDDFLD